MYGAVIATSRRLGVRHEPLKLGSRWSQYWSSGFCASLHCELRVKLVLAYGLASTRAAPVSTSFFSPPQAPEGRQVAASAPGVQSQRADPVGQSSTVGT